MGNLFCSWDSIVKERLAVIDSLIREHDQILRKNQREIVRLQSNTHLTTPQDIIFNERQIDLLVKHKQRLQRDVLELKGLKIKMTEVAKMVTKSSELEQLERLLESTLKRHHSAHISAIKVGLQLDQMTEVQDGICLDSDEVDEENHDKLIARYQERCLPHPPMTMTATMIRNTQSKEVRYESI